MYLSHLNKISTKNISTIILLLILLIVYFNPSGFIFKNNITFCLHKYIFNFDCPGCGMTRAVYFFLHGDFVNAYQFNIAIIPFGFVLVIYLISYFTFSSTYLIIRKYISLSFVLIIFSQYIFKAFIHFSQTV
jgi:hypothetical protein